jgi:hypothetical protein
MTSISVFWYGGDHGARWVQPSKASEAFDECSASKMNVKNANNEQAFI